MDLGDTERKTVISEPNSTLQGVPAGPRPGWVDSDLDVLPLCPTAQPILPNSHLRKQNWDDSGTPNIKVNQTYSLGRQRVPKVL